MMTLTTGARLGPYEIVSTIGAGGMGEVYKARDGSLSREVALKVLPERFSLDADRLARFTREAHILASLNHPNIAAIYGVETSRGIRALVLELVDGQTLDERVAQGPVPIDDALAIARQIACALEAAHDKGIVHRDLKPANVKLRPDGVVKVLDFGLAKALEPSTAVPGDASASPTITSPAMTRAGVILGTAAYMSPEQARGEEADRRSDLWAFGCVLYELVTGTRPFAAKSMPDTIAAVLARDPDWRLLPATTPPSIDRLLKRCLAKDPKNRIADASTARLDIDDALEPSAGVTEARQGVPAHRWWNRPALGWSAAAICLIAAGVLGWNASSANSGEAGRVTRSVIPSPENASIGAPQYVYATQALSIALSPDGRHLVFIGSGASGPWRLWVRPLDGDTARPLMGTENAVRPFWSADSMSVAFFVGDKLKRVDIAGGPVLTICDLPVATHGGGSWNANGTIVFATAFAPPMRGPLYRVSASGGVPTMITAKADGERLRDSFPFFLPDGRHFVYTNTTTHGTSAYVESIDGGEKTRLLDDVSNVQYARGHLLFMRGTTLGAQPFDVERRTLSGDFLPIAQGVLVDPYSRTGVFSVSGAGEVAYIPNTGVAVSRLQWFDRRGTPTGTLGDPGDYNTVNLSPDGKRAAVARRDDTGNMDIWLMDIVRGGQTRLTFAESDEVQAILSPDGTQVVYDSLEGDVSSFHRKALDGSGGTRLDAAITGYPTSWSPDGTFFLFNTPSGRAKSGNDIGVMPLDGTRQPDLFLQTPFNDTRAVLSPDGRWIAYQSNESGRFEIYVARFPGGGGRVQVSTTGATSPRWRRDGTELFYLASNSQMTAATVNGRGAAFEVGMVRPLFMVRMRDQLLGTPYDAAPDGERFLINTFVERNTQPSISLILNWPALLKKGGGQ